MTESAVSQECKKSRVGPEPERDALVLTDVLQALSDPVRLNMVRAIASAEHGIPCARCACPSIPKSTLAHHFKVLRCAGVIRSRQCGTQLHNTLRVDDLQARFPGLLIAVLSASNCWAASLQPATTASFVRPTNQEIA